MKHVFRAPLLFGLSLVLLFSAFTGTSEISPEATSVISDTRAQKFASVVFFYFGDSKFTSLGQETVQLKHAMDGYDRVVLLKHDNVSSFWDLSEKDEKLADIKKTPTETNLKDQLKDLSEKGYVIDLWIFSHGSTSGFRASTGTYGSNSTFSTSDITGLPSYAGRTNLPIRMVFTVACYGNTWADEWQSIGAKTVVAPRYVNFYPNQFEKFAKEWNDNETAKTARDEADTALSRTASQAYILADAVASKNEWGGCPFGKTVLGDHDCAKDYFTDQWLANSEWQNGQSGKDNMNHSSTYLIKGNGNIKKNQVPTW
ncbi:MAG: hypothetical protein J0L94_07355 [Rhodothermia bacterium]|nr:hypothetical protein [Rhodothermia bacterium]